MYPFCLGLKEEDAGFFGRPVFLPGIRCRSINLLICTGLSVQDHRGLLIGPLLGFGFGYERRERVCKSTVAV